MTKAEKLKEKIEKELPLEEKILIHILDSSDDRSDTQFCKDNGISHMVYIRKKMDPRFQAKLSETATAFLKSSVLDVMMSFVKEAKAGSPTQQKMFMEMMDKYTPKVEVNLISEEIHGMSSEDLVKIVSADE